MAWHTCIIPRPPYANAEVDSDGNPVYQPYARRLPDNSNPNATIEMPLPDDVSAEQDSEHKPVVHRFWSSSNP